MKLKGVFSPVFCELHVDSGKAPAYFPRSGFPANFERDLMAKAKKYVYHFSKSKTDGNGSMKALLGGKGANLAEMSSIGVPVPLVSPLRPKFARIITTTVKIPQDSRCRDRGKHYKVEKAMGKKFGDLENPLLLSVRSGARESMPGMMDTILNLGINTKLLKPCQEDRQCKFAWDSYRRFLQM